MPLEGGASGIGVYIREMVGEISRREDVRLSVFGLKDERELLDIGPDAAFVSVPMRFSALASNLLWHAAILPVLASLHRVDVLFLPAGNRRMTMAPPFAGFKVAATVHDLAPFHLPGKYGRLRTYYVTKVLPAAWRRTPLIIAVSEATAGDLTERTGIDPARISVVWNGVDHASYRPMDREEARSNIPKEFNLPERYILYVARIEHPGKNHVGLLRGYARLRRRRPDLEQHLVFCGVEWRGADVVKREISALNLSDLVHFTGFFPGIMLPYLFSGADLFAFPSLFEGFGIPAIEALASGVPVVAAERASLPEIIGEAGLFFDPTDTDGIAKALERGLFDGGFRESSSRMGVIRAGMFSWERSAKETIQALNGLLRR